MSGRLEIAVLNGVVKPYLDILTVHTIFRLQESQYREWVFQVVVHGCKKVKMAHTYFRLWFMEYTIIGVVCGMFVIGTCLLTLGHFSSEPNSRHAFNSSRKNTCGQGLNIFVSSFASISNTYLSSTNVSKIKCFTILQTMIIDVQCTFKQNCATNTLLNK